MRRVIVLTSDTGAGHRSASRALVAGARAAPERALELLELDPYRADDPFWAAFDATDAVQSPHAPARLIQSRVNGGRIDAFADRVVTWYDAVIRHAPWLWGVAYRLTAIPGGTAAYHAVYGRTVADRIRRAISLAGASAVVSVHPLCNRAMAVGADGLPCAVIVTDLVDVHPFWAGHPGARHVVATPEAAGALAQLGVAPGRIATIGLPLRPAFARIDHTAREMRQRLGLDPDRDVVLFMGGGAGAGAMEAVLRACDRESRVGDAAKAGDSITVHYVGVLSADGTEFDNSYDRGTPFDVTLGLNTVIQGWEQGLLGVQAGGQYQLDFPAELGYGESGSGEVIKPGDALTFIVDVVSITPGEQSSEIGRAHV